MNNLQAVKISRHKRICNDVYLISFHRNFDFIPGQIIGLSNSESIAPRLYSICSGANSPTIDILYQVKSDGQLTPELEKNKLGDNLYISAPQGKFIFNNEPAWWIATGTGIAPFYSMLKSGLKPQKLIQGGRFKENIFFFDELKAIDSYMACCSQDSGNGVYEGRLTKYLIELNEIPANINYYLCGSAEMVVDVRNLLISKGVAYNNIITEIYF